MGQKNQLEAKCLAKTKITMREYFTRCAETRADTVRGMARYLGVSPTTISQWAKSRGLQWPEPRGSNVRDFGFEWRGFFGTQRQHCQRWGVSHPRVKGIKSRYGVGYAEALEIAISCDQVKHGFEWRGFFGTRKQHCEQWGVTLPAVRSRCYRHRLSFVEALEIVVDAKRAKSGT